MQFLNTKPPNNNYMHIKNQIENNNQAHPLTNNYEKGEGEIEGVCGMRY